MNIEIILDVFFWVGFVAALVFIGLYIYSYGKFGTSENSIDFPGYDYGACCSVSGFYTLLAHLMRKYYLACGMDAWLYIALDLTMFIIVAWAVARLAKRAHKSIQETKQVKVTVRPEVGVVGRFVKGEITKQEMEKELEELQKER